MSTTTNVYVAGLLFAVTDDELRELGEQFGRVEKAKIIVDGDGKSRGFGFVTFAHAVDANRAIQALEGSMHRGRRLHAAPATGKGAR